MKDAKAGEGSGTDDPCRDRRLICLIGPDGTGKTTQAKLLVQSLRENGYDAEYRWMRFFHVASLPFLGLMRVLHLSEMDTLESGRKYGQHHLGRSRLATGLYGFLLLVDTYLFSILRTKAILTAPGKMLISDRYVYDTVVDFGVSTDNLNVAESAIGRLFLAMIPKNCTPIMLIGSSEILRSRRDEIAHDATLQLRINLYKRMAESLQIPLIDSGAGIADVHEKILKVLSIESNR